MAIETGRVLRQLPPGYRFRPTDEELVGYFMKHKAHDRSVPGLENFRDIDTMEFYSKPPKSLGTVFMFLSILFFLRKQI